MAESSSGPWSAVIGQDANGSGPLYRSPCIKILFLTVLGTCSISTMLLSEVLQTNKGNLQIFAGSVLCLVLLNTVITYRKAVRAINNHPGIRTVFSSQSLWGNIIPYIPGVAIGIDWGVKLKHTIYEYYGWDIISSAGLIPRIMVGYIVADPYAVREIVLHRASFPKDTVDYDALRFFGSNIVVTEGEEWKKHRKIAAPPFSERNNKLVWDETINIMLGLFKKWGKETSVIAVDHANDITLAIALMVIGVAGFGRRVSWDEDTALPPGHKMPFKEALHILSNNLPLKVFAPNWAYPFFKHLQKIQLSSDEIELYMREMIIARRNSEVKEERYDLFSALLDGSDSNGFETGSLSDEELIGNIFVFLLAGHETTAHTTCFALGLLALDQDEQEVLYQHVMSVLPKDKLPGYDLINQFTYTMAVINETLRLFPPVPYIPKYSAEDTTLPCMQPDGTIGKIPVPQRTKLTINTTGLHFNPRYWSDPFAFKPSRFLVPDWPKDAFLPFSGGARACLGKRFAETESVVILSMLVSHYKIELRDPDQYEGLTVLEKREKLLQSKPGITTTPIKVPLVFKKR